MSIHLHRGIYVNERMNFQFAKLYVVFCMGSQIRSSRLCQNAGEKVWILVLKLQVVIFLCGQRDWLFMINLVPAFLKTAVKNIPNEITHIESYE